VVEASACNTPWQDSSIFCLKFAEEFSIKEVYVVNFVFTKPAAVQSFLNLGFKEIERAEPVLALMEYGSGGLDAYKAYLRAEKVPETGRKTGAVIVNCNPFTFGHRYLIETASKECDHLYVITVEEDRSQFPFRVRFDLIKKGTADLKNVTILKGGKFVVSALTFPTYFLKTEQKNQITRLQAELDVRIFARHLAPQLGITHRFVGTEDYCETTAAYNEAMSAILPQFNLQHVIINRKRLESKEIISASHVRHALKQENWEKIRQLVPPTTYDYLKSDICRPIIEKIQQSNSRH